MSERETSRFAKTFSSLTVGFFIAKQAEGISPNTVLDYRKYFKHFRSWGQNKAAFTSTELKAYFAWLREQPNRRVDTLSPKTVYNHWVALRSFYAWLAEGYNTPNPMLAVKAPRLGEPAISVLSADQVKAILKACEFARPVR